MSSELFTSLADLLNTTDDVRVLLSELEQIKESVYKTGDKGLKSVLKNQIRMEVAKHVEPALSEKPDQVLTELEKEVKQLPILRLSIAFQPTQATIERISSWLKTNTTQRWVIDLIINPEISAGVVLEVNGFYRDYSLKEKMAQGVIQATKKIVDQLAV